MGIRNKLAQYRDRQSGVKHCTFDPQGPGVVRIHLIPPRFRLFGASPYIVILNGYYLLPLGDAWALMLSYFIEETNRYDSASLDDEAQAKIRANTLRRMRKVYPIDRPVLEDDLDDMLDILFEVAHGGTPQAEIEALSIRAYAPRMEAPHRVDLMVSAMTDETGGWKCNQKCRFCYAAGQTLAGVREMTTEEWKQAIDRLRTAHVPMLTFTGGEPTLRPDLCELVAHAKWFVTRLNTNGIALSPSLAQALKEADLDSVQITLYSADKTVHNALVGGDHFDDTVRGLQNALSAGLDVSVNTPLCRLNEDYPATLQKLAAWGVRYVTVSGLICTGTAKLTHGDNDLSSEELAAILAEAKAFCDGHGMEMDFTSPGLVPASVLDGLGLHTPSCGAALSNMAVAPDGTVVPCQSWLGSDAALGHILTDDFKKLWKHPRARALRQMTDAEALSCPFRARAGKEVPHG